MELREDGVDEAVGALGGFAFLRIGFGKSFSRVELGRLAIFVDT